MLRNAAQCCDAAPAKPTVCVLALKLDLTVGIEFRNLLSHPESISQNLGAQCPVNTPRNGWLKYVWSSSHAPFHGSKPKLIQAN